MSDRIHVTQSYIPEWDEFAKYCKQAFDNKWLTNNGSLVMQLRREISDYLGCKNVSVVSNGTIALQLPLKNIELGEIITTPYSYVATINAILWEGHKPVFVDIDKSTWCIDANSIKAKITRHTKAILATHVYGIPCDVKLIEEIAKEYGLIVIYDAAHAFGVEYKGKSLLNYGDYSTLSMHATKLFHSAEGGLIVCKDEEQLDQMDKMKSFGHKGDIYYGLGINGKMSELHAAMGLAVLPKVPELIEQRKIRVDLYEELLADSPIQRPSIPVSTNYNYSYFPVLFKNAEKRSQVEKELEKNNVFARRYFYPSLNTLDHVEGQSECSISEDYAQRVLCLPLYANLSLEDVTRIAKIIVSVV